MTRYNAREAKVRGERTIGEASTLVGAVLWELQGKTMSHRPSRPKIIERTDTGKHYRVPLRLAAHLSLETVDPPGAHQTEPPTALVTVGTMVEGLETYARHERAGNIARTIVETLVSAAELP